MKQSEAIRIHNEAVELAQKATAKYLEEHGDDFPCGFAGVKIKPATQSFARQLKKAGSGWARKWSTGECMGFEGGRAEVKASRAGRDLG